MDMIDTSWKSNKKSLWGFGMGVLFIAAARLIGLGGILGLVIFFVGFFVGYKFLGNEKPGDSSKL